MAINTPKNESIEWGNMVSHSNDTGSLCESQHNILHTCIIITRKYVFIMYFKI